MPPGHKCSYEPLISCLLELARLYLDYKYKSGLDLYKGASRAFCRVVNMVPIYSPMSIVDMAAHVGIWCILGPESGCHMKTVWPMCLL